MVFFHWEGERDIFFFSREGIILRTRETVHEVDDFCCWVTLLLFVAGGSSEFFLLVAV